MNTVILIGNVTKKPELRWTTGNEPKAVARFSIGVNEGYGENKRTSFPSIAVWGKAAENCEKYLDKGSKVCIKGRIQTGSYEKDGRKVYTTDIVADNYGGVEFLNTKSEGTQSPEPQSPEPQGGFTALSDDDCPF